MKAADLLRATTLGLLSAAPARAHAQNEVGAQLDLLSSYVWREVTLTNKPVAQPDLWISFPASNAVIIAAGGPTSTSGSTTIRTTTSARAAD